jgi:hypothetical protein
LKDKKRLWDQNIGSEIQYLQAKAAYESQQSLLPFSSMQQLAKYGYRTVLWGNR